MWNVDLLDTHLYLLETDIPSKHFVCLHNAFKTSSRLVFQTSSRQVLKRCSRHLQGSNFSSSKTSSSCLQGIFQTSSRCLGRRKIVTVKTCWRCLQDLFKTNKYLPGYLFLLVHGLLVIFEVLASELIFWSPLSFFFYWKYSTFGSIKNYLLPFVKSI